MLPGACHNAVRSGANYSACPVATFVYGTRDAWNAFTRRYLERVRELVTPEPPPGGMLCTEQDVMADVLTRHSDEHLAEDFTTSDADGWGWRQAQAVSVRCGSGLYNLGNRCVKENFT